MKNYVKLKEKNINKLFEYAIIKNKISNSTLYGGAFMITKNPMQLKIFIKNKATKNNISVQLVMHNYMLERLLERISLTKYRFNFILKGGFQMGEQA